MKTAIDEYGNARHALSAQFLRLERFVVIGVRGPMRMHTRSRLTGLLIALAVACSASVSAATPEEIQTARAEIEQIQAVFLSEVQVATGLPKTEIELFMPGGRLYGHEITEFHRLTSPQLEALRLADTRKKSAIAAIRQKYGIEAETAQSRGSRF